MAKTDKPAPIEDTDNPSNPDDFATMPDDGRRYRIGAASVGTHQQGDVVDAKAFGLGAQIGRLINLGAIGRVEDHADVAVAPGPLSAPLQPPPVVLPSLTEGQIRPGQTFPVADPALKVETAPVVK
jgi:hypothetical protein